MPTLPPDASGLAAACSANASNATQTNLLPPATPRRYPFRRALNHRCSGLHHCNFILTEDVPEASHWGSGLVYINYACMKGASASRWCEPRGTVAAGGEAFLLTPGYPQYYVGERQCLWALRAPPGRRLALRLLDVSLRETPTLSENCTDRLSVSEGDHEIINICGEIEDLIEIISEGESLSVNISLGSKTLFPKRGVLLHYRVLECIHPSTPKDGYVVYRNDTFGEYMCNSHFVFPDTRSRQRVLLCVNNAWNNTLPNCTENNGVLHGSYNTIGSIRLNPHENSTVYATPLNQINLIFDIILPTVIICILLVGNSLIVLVIFYLRKRNYSVNIKETDSI